MENLKVRDVINESVNVGDEFGNELEFETHERGSGSPLDGTVGVQVKVFFDNGTDLSKEVKIDPSNGKKFVQFSVLDHDELKALRFAIDRWLAAEKE